ncbi:hypothetical protein C9374_005650 [Naegleria lovaniensis]|uniref:DUF4116 domain-containing protein n=1 Tax=Naegleria lovaniensis TaxID=51637 RepID=A0AA88KJH7_NAELO|nr:uncharacterized protein C9374_005650 [Naegleria lovaniensis]KAG2381858.1 hypothetical protein C9374_005650 [Naegleria lovaniensis]
MFLRLGRNFSPNGVLPHSDDENSNQEIIPENETTDPNIPTLFLASDTIESIAEFLDEQDREMAQHVCMCFQEACRTVARREFQYMWHDENLCLRKPLSEPPVDEEFIVKREMEFKTKFPLCLREFLKITNGRPAWSDEVDHVSNMLNRVELWKYNHARTVILLGMSTQNSMSLTLDPKHSIIRLNHQKINFKHYVTMQNRTFNHTLYDAEKFKSKKYFPYHIQRSVYSILPSIFTSQRWFTLHCVQRDGLCLQYADMEFKKDPQIVKEAYRQNPKSFKFCSDELQNQNTELVMELFQIDPECLLTYLTKTHELFHRKEFMLQAVQIGGQFLRKASSDLKNDRELVLKAIENYPDSISYASLELKNDFEIVMKALNGNVRTYQHISGSLKLNEQTLTLVLERNGRLLRDLPEELQQDEQLQLLAVKTDPFSLTKFKFKPPESQYREFALQAVKSNGWCMHYLPRCFAQDREIVTALIQSSAFGSNHGLFRIANDQLRNDKELVKLAIQHNPMALQYASEALREDLDIVLLAIRRNGKALSYASKKLQCKQYVAMQRNADVVNREPNSLSSYEEEKASIPLKNRMKNTSKKALRRKK